MYKCTYGSVPLLNDHNYSTWSLRMKCLLVMAHLWSLVLETRIKQGIEDELDGDSLDDCEDWWIREWEAKKIKFNNDVEECTGILLGSCSDHIMLKISHLDSPKKIWDELKHLYDSANTANARQLLQRKFNLVTYNPEKGVDEMFASMDAIEERLREYKEAISTASYISLAQRLLPNDYKELCVREL